MVKEVKSYNINEKINSLCEDNQIVFPNPKEFYGLEAIGLLPLVLNELNKFLEEKHTNNFYILSITDPNTKANYGVQIKYDGGKKEVKKEKEKDKLKFYDDGDLIDLVVTPPVWLIENQIPLNEIGILAGKRGERKSFTALYQAICVASGKDCMGNKVSEKRRVLYVGEEDSLIAMLPRIKALKKGLGVEKEKLPIKYFIENNLKLDKQDGKMEEFEKVLKVFKPQLIIVDTFQRCVSFDADIENQATSDFFLATIKRFQRLYGGTWLFIHHLRKGLSNGKPPEDMLDEIRGASEIVNIARFVLGCAVPKGSKNLMTLSVLKMSHSVIPDPKVVSFDETENKEIKVRYVGLKEEVLANAMRCAERIKEWLTDKQKTEFKTKEIQDVKKELGYGKATVAEAIAFLLRTNWTSSDKRGYYKINTEDITQEKLEVQ